MNGSDRSTGTALRRLVARDSPYTAVRIVELDLADPGELRSPGCAGPVEPDGRVLALVRLHGHPLGLVTATGAPGDPAGLRRALLAAAHRDLPIPPRAGDSGNPVVRRLAAGPPPSSVPAAISVVVATRNRPGPLRQCLDSLLRTGYPRLEVLVVDNAPDNDDTETLVRGHYPGQVRYLREPVAGLARAHNRALAEATGPITAFTDDDVLVDRDWPAALAGAFAASERIGCVTGLILPAELETRAQAELQRHGGYDKGFAPRTWSLAEPPDDPLFPFTAGRFGSGANMAYRTGLLRALGGFDPATGTGTPARGGDDLLGFFRLLVAGATLAYQPDAIVWHRHRRGGRALADQAFGYGAGFGAFLAAAVANEPAMLPALARRLPGGLHNAATRRRAGADPDGDWSARLTLLELRGMLYGPLGYLRSRHQARRQPRHGAAVGAP